MMPLRMKMLISANLRENVHLSATQQQQHAYISDTAHHIIDLKPDGKVVVLVVMYL